MTAPLPCKLCPNPQWEDHEGNSWDWCPNCLRSMLDVEPPPPAETISDAEWNDLHPSPHDYSGVQKFNEERSSQ